MHVYTKKRVQREVLVGLVCDRCKREVPRDAPAFGEALRHHAVAGFGSVFGDGNMVECDLCEHCFKELIGPFCRVRAVH